MRTGIRSLAAAVLCAGFLLIAGGDARAQETETVTASITIPQVLFIDVSSNAVDFPDPSGTEFNTGHVDASTTTDIDTRGNVVHDVTVEADAANFTGPVNKSASDLEWSTDGNTWNGLATSPTDVVTGLARGVHNSAVSVDYRILLDWGTDEAGDYSLDFTYTVVAN